MKPIDNPLLIVVLALLGVIAVQVGFILIRCDVKGMRNTHYWMDEASIRRLTSERDLWRISEICLPGAWMVVGGLPQALAIAFSVTTLIVGLREAWWCVAMVPLVYVGAETVSGAALRCLARARLAIAAERTVKSVVASSDKV